MESIKPVAVPYERLRAVYESAAPLLALLDDGLDTPEAQREFVGALRRFGQEYERTREIERGGAQSEPQRMIETGFSRWRHV